MTTSRTEFDTKIELPHHERIFSTEASNSPASQRYSFSTMKNFIENDQNKEYYELKVKFVLICLELERMMMVNSELAKENQIFKGFSNLDRDGLKLKINDVLVENDRLNNVLDSVSIAFVEKVKELNSEIDQWKAKFTELYPNYLLLKKNFDMASLERDCLLSESRTLIAKIRSLEDRLAYFIVNDRILQEKINNPSLADIKENENLKETYRIVKERNESESDREIKSLKDLLDDMKIKNIKLEEERTEKNTKPESNSPKVHDLTSKNDELDELKEEMHQIDKNRKDLKAKLIELSECNIMVDSLKLRALVNDYLVDDESDGEC